MRWMNLTVGLIQVAGVVGLTVACFQATSPVLVVLYGAANAVNGIWAGHNIGRALFGSDAEQLGD